MQRRDMLKFLMSIPMALSMYRLGFSGSAKPSRQPPPQVPATIFKAVDDDPALATRNLLNSLGGIDSIIGKNNIVVLKPNSQWWNQGMTNTDVMAEFIEQILAIKGFSGEIIVADNHQAQKDNDRGWTTEYRNGRFNLNELVEYFQNRGFRNVTKYHWHPAGPNPDPLQFDGHGNNVVESPAQGDGYIWPEKLYYKCPYGNKTILAYPVFTSSYSGITIDLKDGAYKDGAYTGQPVKFINFSALNHHGRYAGATASIKNYMGVVDMSCGYPGPRPSGTYNTHHVGASNLFKLISWAMKKSPSITRLPWFYDIYLGQSVFRFRYTGGVLGRFMKHIRRADLNIITAIRVGWGSRIRPDEAFTANTILASTDPVALDYWATANILLPGTKEATANEELTRLHDPNIIDGPLRTFIEECRRELGGTTDPGLIEIVQT
jgi:hypothetical protein